MKHVRVRVGALVAMAAALLSPLAVPPPAAFACSCAFAPIPNDLRFSDSVFSGNVVRVGGDSNGGDSSAPREILVAVDHVWLGSVSGQATVVTASSEASCGYESFVEGDRFLIYAKASNEVFETDLCSPTRPYDDAAVKLLEEVTGPGVEVEPIVAGIGPGTVAELVATVTRSTTKDDSRPWLPMAVGSAGAIAVAVLGVAVAIRWRRYL